MLKRMSIENQNKQRHSHAPDTPVDEKADIPNHTVTGPDTTPVGHRLDPSSPLCGALRSFQHQHLYIILHLYPYCRQHLHDCTPIVINNEYMTSD